MTNDFTITSKTNSLVKEILALRRSSRHRRDKGLSLAEGFKVLKLAMEAGNVPVVVLYDGVQAKEQEKQFLLERARKEGSIVRAVSPDVFLKLSTREGPLDCIASVRIKETSLGELVLGASPLIVVTEGIEKPGNLGTLIRTASAAGANAFIAADSQADIYSPASIQASLGEIFRIPVVRCSTKEAFVWLQRVGVTVVATSPSAKKIYYESDLTKPTAIVIGNEYRGLSPQWLEAGLSTSLGAGISVRVPMPGPADSLNGTIAGAIVIFEALRQRALNQL